MVSTAKPKVGQYHLMLDKLKDSKVILWAVAFVGVSVLVGLGKLKPETIEYLLFALLGQAALPSNKKEPSDDSTPE